jgi:hypothetical protein
MSDGSIIRKIREDSRVVSHTEWFRYVREYNIFNEAQARFIANALIDVQKYARAEHDSDINDLVDELDKVHDDIYAELDKLRERFASLEGALNTITTLKGVPGKQGDRGPRGETGRQGTRGEKGDVGPPGAAAPHWIGVKIEGFDLITVLSDGTLGPRIDLQEMFVRGAFSGAL